jgi:hypothetical protein
MVSTANATLLTSTPGVNMLGNRPMMVPPNMLTDIAGNSTPSTPGNEPVYLLFFHAWARRVGPNCEVHHTCK